MAATRPDLYRAYNRPALSAMTKNVRVRILDNLGNPVTSGPDASIYLTLSVRHFYTYDAAPTAQEVGCGAWCA